MFYSKFFNKFVMKNVEFFFCSTYFSKSFLCIYVAARGNIV